MTNPTAEQARKEERDAIVDCRNCKGEGWVCESHMDLPWNGDGCECGAGAPCPVCQQELIFGPWQQAFDDIYPMALDWFDIKAAKMKMSDRVNFRSLLKRAECFWKRGDHREQPHD